MLENTGFMNISGMFEFHEQSTNRLKIVYKIVSVS